MTKKGIPKEVLDELNIEIKEETKDTYETKPIVEKHQIKLPIPAEIRREIKIKKGKKIKLTWDKKNNTITYHLSEEKNA